MSQGNFFLIVEPLLIEWTLESVDYPLDEPELYCGFVVVVVWFAVRPKEPPDKCSCEPIILRQPSTSPSASRASKFAGIVESLTIILGEADH
jgi:hypothetical protein